MTHPGELLVDYVDGTLHDDARAEVEAHLRACEMCREDLRLAQAGRHAAGSLPTPAVPGGLADRAIAEAERVAARRHPKVSPIPASGRRRPDAPRWVGLITAAAVIVAIAVIAPRLGSGSGGVTEQAAGSATTAAAAPAAGDAAASKVEESDEDYSPEDLTDATRLAQSSLRAATSTSEGAQLGYALDAGAAFEAFAGTPSATSVNEASHCLDQAFRSARGKLVRVVIARYDGTEAYFGIYLVNPGRDAPSSELRIDVATVDGCQILAQSSAKL